MEQWVLLVRFEHKEAAGMFGMFGIQYIKTRFLLKC